jgi:virginiamycin B lyase
MRFIHCRRLVPVPARHQRQTRAAISQLSSQHELESRILLSAFAEISPPADWIAPLSSAAGPDGNVWFTDGGCIGRVSPSGTFTYFPTPGQEMPVSIAAGPDGNLWYSKAGQGGSVGQITPSGVITEFPLPDPGDNLANQDTLAITVAANGNLWFSIGNCKIGWMTPAGAVTEYQLDYPVTPTKLAAGSDGNIWFIDPATISIGKITPTGDLTEFPLATDETAPDAIVAGPDGNLWFTESDHIGKITTSGTITDYALPTVGSGLPSITVGPDGNLWFTEADADKIGRITTAGVVTEFALPASAPNNLGFHGPGAHPMTIAAGSDNRMWVFDVGESNGIVAVALDQPLTPGPIPTAQGTLMTFSGIPGSFHDSDSAATASDFAATIVWGDGATTAGSISTTFGGGFNVNGTHTYSATGTYTITVFITDISSSNDLGGSTLTTTTSFTASGSVPGGGVPRGGTVPKGHSKKHAHPTVKHPKPPLHHANAHKKEPPALTGHHKVRTPITHGKHA